MKSFPVKIPKALVLAIPALAGASSLIALTGKGIGIYPDSVMYVLIARSLTHGAGWTVQGTPITWFPPLYPLLLASSRLFGSDPLEAARWIQALVWMGNIAFVGVLAYRFSSGSLAATLVASILAAVSVDLIATHSFALSDGLFLFFSLSGLFFLGLHREGVKFLVLSAGCFGLAALTRYAGYGWIVGGAAAIFILGAEGAIGRIRKTLIFTSIAFGPSLCWILRNRATSTALGRTLDLHPFLGAQELESLNHAFSAWLFQWKVADAAWITVVGLSLFLLLFIRAAVRRGIAADKPRFDPAPMLIAVSAYVLQLIGAAALLQADLFRDSVRMLVPVHVVTLVVVAGELSRWWSVRSGPFTRAWKKAIVGAACAIAAYGGITYMIRIAQDGQGYASSAVRYSPIIRKAAALDPHIAIYTNLVLPVELYTDKIPSYIPMKIVNGTQRVNEGYDGEMDQMARTLRSGTAVIVMFNRGSNWLVEPGIDEIGKRIPLTCIDREVDGGIYSATAPSMAGPLPAFPSNPQR